MYEMTGKLIDKLHELEDWCSFASPLENHDEDTFISSVGSIVNELWEMSILFRKMKEPSTDKLKKEGE